MTFFFDTVAAEIIAGLCAFAALVLALYSIVQHLRHYTEPMFQRYIVRIIFMVPVYAACSFASLVAEDAAIYIASVRDCYEAWIIYNFMSLCLAYVGGPGAVEIKMQGVTLLPSWAAGTCCLPPLPVNGHFVRVVKQGALQFVFLKPILTALTLILYGTGHYTEGDWSVGSSYLWITVIYNITYTLALYALLLFYIGTHELLAPFRPLLKFVLVKSVIFLTFWQGLFISIAVATGSIPSPNDGNNVQNFLICVEMLPASICIAFAFPWQDFAGEGAGRGFAPDAVTHAMSLGDVVTDTVHQFAPTYQKYVLYSDGTAKRAAGGPSGGGTALHDDDGGLLPGVEMADAGAWEDEESGVGRSQDLSGSPPSVGRSKYLAADNDTGNGGRRGGSRGGNSDAEARWQSINISPS